MRGAKLLIISAFFLAIALHFAKHVVSTEGTTPSPSNVTQSSSTTVVPANVTDECQKMTIKGPQKQTFLPSEEVTIGCTCFNENGKPSCPRFTSKEEAEGTIDVDSDVSMTNNSCTTIKNITARTVVFTEQRSLEVSFVCEKDGKTDETEFRFEAGCQRTSIVGPIKQTFLPSEEVTINCTCVNTNSTPTCPKFNIKEEAKDMISDDTDHYMNNTECTTKTIITAKVQAFDRRRRVEVPFICGEDGVKEEKIFRFEQQPSGKRCEEDIDCLHLFQKCENNTCRCYEDTPAFVWELNNCVPGISYGHKCEYQEECQAVDANSICEEKFCKCRKDYRIKSDSDHTCITDGAMFLLPSQAVIASLVTCAMFITGLRQ